MVNQEKLFLLQAQKQMLSQAINESTQDVSEWKIYQLVTDITKQGMGGLLLDALDEATKREPPAKAL